MAENQVLTPDEVHYSVSYKKPTITIEYFDELKQQLAGNITKYQSLAVTPENVADARKKRAELNQLTKQLNARRLEIKRDYNQPFKDFEEKVKELTDMVDQVNVPINRAIKEIEEQEKQKRLETVQREIEEFAPQYGVAPEEVTIQSNWTTKSISKVQREREIAQALLNIQTKHKQEENDLAATEAYAKNAGLDPSGWLQMLAEGHSFSEIRIMIDNELMRRKKAAERAQKEAEAAAAVAALNQQQVGNKTVDTETGEVMQSQQLDLTEPAQPETTVAQQPTAKVYRRCMAVTGTADQINAVAAFMKQNGIKFESVKEA